METVFFSIVGIIVILAAHKFIQAYRELKQQWEHAGETARKMILEKARKQFPHAKNDKEALTKLYDYTSVSYQYARSNKRPTDALRHEMKLILDTRAELIAEEINTPTLSGIISQRQTPCGPEFIITSAGNNSL